MACRMVVNGSDIHSQRSSNQLHWRPLGTNTCIGGCLLWYFVWYVGQTKSQRSIAQPGSAPGLGPGGRKFESYYSDQCVAVPEWSKGTDCKSVKPWVQISPATPKSGRWCSGVGAATGLENQVLRDGMGFDSSVFRHTCILNSVGRVPRLHRGCRRFEPVRMYQPL